VSDICLYGVLKKMSLCFHSDVVQHTLEASPEWWLALRWFNHADRQLTSHHCSVVTETSLIKTVLHAIKPCCYLANTVCQLYMCSTDLAVWPRPPLDLVIKIDTCGPVLILIQLMWSRIRTEITSNSSVELRLHCRCRRDVCDHLQVDVFENVIGLKVVYMTYYLSLSIINGFMRCVYIVTSSRSSTCYVRKVKVMQSWLLNLIRMLVTTLSCRTSSHL